MNDSMIISDELLAAFLDGNTNAEDTMRVLKAAEQDEELRELIRIVSEVDEDMAGRKPAKVKELPMTAMAARKKESYLCDIECEEFVLHQLGIETTHKTLLDEAYRNCWLRDSIISVGCWRKTILLSAAVMILPSKMWCVGWSMATN